ncbi:S-layer protein [Thermococcus sp.]
MKRLAAFLIFLLAGSLVPVGLMSAEENQPVATFHVVAGQTWTKEIPGAIVNWTGEFDYSKTDGWEAGFAVYFTETGHTHGVPAAEKGFVDADGKYIWILTDVQTEDNPETKKLGLLESWNELTVKFIDPIAEKVVIDNDYNGETYALHVGDEIDISGELSSGDIYEKTVLELKDIETGLFGSKAVLVLHHITAVSGTVEIYPYQTYQNATKEEQNQTNSSPKIPPLNLSTPTAMIVVGEHAAGADVAAGAKVGIAVQKWIDILKDKTAGEAARAFLGPLGPAITKAAMAPVQNLNADAMLDTEVQNPDTIAPIVYTVGGPVANEYTKALLEKNADRLPVKFVKEGNQWYIEDKNGNKWGKGYGLIMIIPAAENPADLQIRLMEGKIKMVDVVVAGTDRWGTYAACDLLQGEFMKPILGEKPRPELEYFIEVQGRMLLLFGQDPLKAFTISIDPTNPFKLQTTAIIVDKKGKIVKVLIG